MRHATGLWMLIYLAAVGYALVVLPPKLIDQHNQLAERNRTLGTIYLAVVGLGVLILAVLTAWILWQLVRNTRRKGKTRLRRGRSPSQLSPAEQRRELADNLERSTSLVEDQNIAPALRDEIQRSIAELEAKRDADRLEIVAFGTISSGKSSLLNALAGRDVFRSHVIGGTTAHRAEIPWPGKDRVFFVDTPGLAEVHGEVRAADAATAAKDADLVLFVVDGPLKAYECDLIERLIAMEKRILLCLNKEDWYPPESREQLQSQIAEQVAPDIGPEDIIPVRSRGTSRRRVRVEPDGSEREEIMAIEPDIERLAKRMLEVVEHEGSHLLLANLLLQSRGLVDNARARVMASLDQRADTTITKYMWAAGSATAINPLPLLDIAGGTAVTVKMVLDLARIYQQPIDIDVVVTMLGELGKNLVAMLGATAVAPALASAIGTVLKTVPGIGTIAGGLLQGSVQALATRWIGHVFCEFFRNEMKPPPGGLAELARRKWSELTTAEQIRKLVLAGRIRCKGNVDSTDNPNSSSEDE